MSPPVFVAKLSNCRVVGPRGAVVSPENTLFTELSPEFPLTRPRMQHSLFRTPELQPPERRSEWFGLVTAPGCTTYFHWLFDGLPRAGLLERFRDVLDFLLVPRELQPFHRRSLSLLSFPEEMLLSLEWGSHLELENLIAPSLPGQTPQVPRWVCEWLRKRFPFARPSRGRRIYVSRRDATQRLLANEEELIAALEQLDVEPVVTSELEWEEQIALFSECDLIVGPHGAGLSNVVFCHAGVRVIEIFSPEHVYGAYWGVTDQIGGRYWYIVGSKLADSTGRNLAGDVADFTVDPEQVVRTVRLALTS
jgi:capsular polysaccharide biosynthesis protein